MNVASLLLVVAIGCAVPPEPEWIPSPQAGVSIVLEQGEKVRSLTLEQWRAVAHSGTTDQWWLARTGYCEGHLDPTSRNGVHLGSWQVNPAFHGSVPSDLDGQAKQAALIQSKYGREPWDTSEGCPEWNR